MLGEKIYEWTGKVQAQRILPADAEGSRMEITFSGPFQGHGRLASFKGTGTATYIATARPGGIFQGEGQAVIMGNKGDAFSIHGGGLGKLKGGKLAYRGSVTFRSGASKLNWLNAVVGVFEYEQDMNTQEVTFTCYEWK